AGGVLRLIDQTLLPDRLEVIICADAESVAAAIRSLRVRGAPAIGIAAAYGLALGAREALPAGGITDPDEALEQLSHIAASLRTTRPTAVNIAWALDRLLAVAERHVGAGEAVSDLPARLLVEAHAIAAEDAAACRAMGELGAALIADGDTLLTHCNAGALATAGIGTALAPIFIAHQSGKRVHVFVDETRPVLQGARLTSWELQLAGVPQTLIADNMAAHFMRRGAIKAVFVGADRIAANGDFANKIGTYGLAVLARAHGIPLYVVAPCSSIDLALPNGDAVPIEERPEDEVTSVRGVRIAPEGVPVANPAFDVTPAEYVAAIVTQAGIARPPYEASLAALWDENVHRMTGVTS
ncbi:MAG TPA: S-methyl-5-thioribose-1-phosphate isomerase, partial [Ktedonobacterales bacterium]|nr:S-methyl-5-thioribose-1-phosphate isomerase [Ktedonobacterales bacterium]